MKFDLVPIPRDDTRPYIVRQQGDSSQGLRQFGFTGQRTAATPTTLTTLTTAQMNCTGQRVNVNRTDVHVADGTFR